MVKGIKFKVIIVLGLLLVIFIGCQNKTKHTQDFDKLQRSLVKADSTFLNQEIDLEDKEQLIGVEHGATEGLDTVLGDERLRILFLLGRRWTVRALFLALLGQSREALGHAAAHAEVLGVPPPWVRLRRASEASID